MAKTEQIRKITCTNKIIYNIRESRGLVDVVQSEQLTCRRKSIQLDRSSTITLFIARVFVGHLIVRTSGFK